MSRNYKNELQKETKLTNLIKIDNSTYIYFIYSFDLSYILLFH